MERADFERLLGKAISDGESGRCVGFAGVRYGVPEKSVASFAVYLAAAPVDFHPVEIPHSCSFSCIYVKC